MAVDVALGSTPFVSCLGERIIWAASRIRSNVHQVASASIRTSIDST